MESTSWILISIAFLIILLAIIFIFLRIKKKIPNKGPDYYVWFWLGICWLGAGIPFGITEKNWGISLMGLIFMILGLVHKKDWKKNHVMYKDLTPAEKKFKFWIILILGIVVLFGLVAFLIF